MEKNDLISSYGLSTLGRSSLMLPPTNSQMSGNINEIAQALSKFQGELQSASKDSKGYGYSYSDLATVINTAKPFLSANGLSVVQLVGETTDKFVTLTTILSHSSGQFFLEKATMPLIEMKGCNLAQMAGSSLSYLRRYAYQSIIGMPSEDNDASSEGFKSAPSKTSFKPEASANKVKLASDSAENDTPKVEEKRLPFKRSKAGAAKLVESNNDDL